MNAVPEPRDNPYSRMAVAKVGTTPPMTVETAAFRHAFAELGDYLRPDSSAGEGPVLAVVGEYGTGKTHLGIALRERAARHIDKPNQSMFIEATSKGLSAVYRSSLEQLGLAGIRARAHAYYTSVVADELQENEAPSTIVEAVRSGNHDPSYATQDHVLQLSTIRANTKSELNRVTRHADISIALFLLIEGGCDKEVWQWLNGSSPSEVLAERGVSGQIDTLDAKVAALAALARLHTGQSTPFVMIIDECERTLPDDPADRATVASALRSLILAFSEADAMLILIGLPDFMHSLPGDVLQRLPKTLPMTRLTEDDVRMFIEGTHAAKLGARRLAPFTTEVVRQLLAVTNGNPRKIIRYCHQLYDRVSTPEGLVTVEMVNELVRGEDPAHGRFDVGTTVGSALEAESLTFHRQLYRRQEGNSDQDFVITVDGAKCVVLITSAVVTEDDMTALDDRMRRLRSGDVREFVVVVGGAIHSDLAQRLRDQMMTEPLVFTEPKFDDRFRDRLRTVVSRMRESVSKDPWAPVLRLLQQMDNQLLSIYGFLGQLEERHESLRSMLERRLGPLQDKLADVARAGLAESNAESAGSALPPRVDRHFQGVLAELTTVLPWGDHIRDAFNANPRSSGESTAVSWLRARPNWRAVAVALLVRPIVVEFQIAVADWYQRRGEESNDRWLRQLESLCQAYDSATEYLPLPQLSFLSGDAPRRTSSGDPAEPLQDRLSALAETVSTEVRAMLSENQDKP